MTIPPNVGKLVAAAVAGLVAGCSQAAAPHTGSAAPPGSHPIPTRAEPSSSAPVRPLLGRLVKAEPGALAIDRLGDVQAGERGQVFVRAPTGWQLVGNGVVESVEGTVTRIGLRDPEGDTIGDAVLDIAAGAEVKLERRSWTSEPPSVRFICCKGRNECKGRGNCKTEQNDCKGKNECKGRGGCAPADCPEKR